MADEIITKRCSRCKQVKSLSEFYKRNDRPCGYRGDCKKCHKIDDDKWRKRNPERKSNIQNHYHQSEKGKIVSRRASKKYVMTHPDGYSARNAVRSAIITGKLLKANLFKCRDCGKKAEQYHHYKGYTPEHHFDVIPLCRKCHRKYNRFHY